MELVLLLKVSEENSILVYSPNENEEFTVDVLPEDAKQYRKYLQEDEDFMLIFDKTTYTFEMIENEGELR
ncbi:MAG: hypothetical protein L0K82_07530 [Pisciglobus halotolerans]|nr:hypothetical protein [Pisciglobus halotolerans]